MLPKQTSIDDLEIGVTVDDTRVENPNDFIDIRELHQRKTVDHHWNNRLKASAIKTKRNRKANKAARKARRN